MQCFNHIASGLFIFVVAVVPLPLLRIIFCCLEKNRCRVFFYLGKFIPFHLFPYFAAEKKRNNSERKNKKPFIFVYATTEHLN